MTRRVVEDFVSLPRATAPPEELQALTSRELEVLDLLARGRTNQEIAAALVVTHGTAKDTHFARVLQKLDRAIGSKR